MDVMIDIDAHAVSIFGIFVSGHLSKTCKWSVVYLGCEKGGLEDLGDFLSSWSGSFFAKFWYCGRKN